MSTDFIWWFVVYPIAIYGDQNVCEVHNFHAVLPALHPAAHVVFEILCETVSE